MADQTVQELIKSALRKLGAIAVGETPSSAEMADALLALRILMREWSAHSFLVFKKDLVTHALSGTSSYTIGSGADINTTRPVKILDAYVNSTGHDYPVQIITAERYAQISDKSDGATVPVYLWYNPGYSQGTIYLYPAGGGTLTMICLTPLTDFTTLTEDVVLPGEYDAAIVWNLAIEMAPEYGKEATPTMIMRAERARDQIITNNAALAWPEASLDVEKLDRGYYGGASLGQAAPTGYRESFTNDDLVAGVVTITHGLGYRYNAITLYDNSGTVITPDSITPVDTNNVAIDLTSEAPISGTWNVRII